MTLPSVCVTIQIPRPVWEAWQTPRFQTEPLRMLLMELGVWPEAVTSIRWRMEPVSQAYLVELEVPISRYAAKE
jgi:hypothetical protein